MNTDRQTDRQTDLSYRTTDVIKSQRRNQLIFWNFTKMKVYKTQKFVHNTLRHDSVE